jgi:hypothetical protein
MQLDELLIAAAEAPPESRIEFRDAIAGHQDDAVEKLMAAEWIGDPKYAGFAVQTIRRAGELGARTAPDALRRAASLVTTEWHRQDIEMALVSLGARRGRPNQQKKKLAPQAKGPAIAPEHLVVGNCYRRSELHDGGLGGNRQKGISYPANGTHCLLFSDPSKVHVYGYKDRPEGDHRYRYFGEWSGTGDMTMTAGNQAIADRSPELYLFTAASCGHIFRGRYSLLEVQAEKTSRDGRQFNAIVFLLERTQ